MTTIILCSTLIINEILFLIYFAKYKLKKDQGDKEILDNISIKDIEKYLREKKLGKIKPE
jgi:hypothetical protein